MIQFRRAIKGRQINVRTHEGMHADEMFALFQIERLASQDFLDRYCGDGELDLGVGGKEFDPHTVVPGKPLRPEECCSLLVAEALGATKIMMVAEFLNFFRDRRRHRGGSAFDLAYLVDMMHFKGEGIASILAWAFMGFEAKIRGPGMPVKPGAAIDLIVRGEKLRVQTYGGIDAYVVTMLFLLEDFFTDTLDSFAPDRRWTVVRHQLSALAKRVGVDQALELKLILEMADRSTKLRFDLSALIRDLYQAGRPSQQIVDWGIAGLRAKYFEQQQFFGPTRSEFERGIQIEMIPGPHGKLIKKGIIHSDNPQMARFARSRYGGSLDVFIHVRSTGNVYIATRFESGIKLHRVAYLLSLAEQHASGGVVDDQWEHLTAPTLLPDGKWFFQHSPQALFNGAIRLEVQVPRTSLPLAEIDRLVKAGLRPPSSQ